MQDTSGAVVPQRQHSTGDAASDPIEKLQRPRISWDDPGIIEMLEKWTDHTKCYQWMHELARIRYETLNQFVTFISGIVFVVNNLSSTVISSLDNGKSFPSWLFGAFGVLQTIFTVYISQYSLKATADNYKQYANNWLVLKMDLEMELSLPMSAHADCSTFVDLVRKRMDQLCKTSDQSIPWSIREACYNEFSKVPGFCIPEICGEIQHTRAYGGNLNFIANTYIPPPMVPMSLVESLLCRGGVPAPPAATQGATAPHIDQTGHQV